MRKYYILFLAVICAAGIVLSPESGYCKLSIMTDTELDSVAAQSGITGSGITGFGNIFGISLDTGTAGLPAFGNDAEGALSLVDICYKGNINITPATAYNFSVINSNAFSFDVDLASSFCADELEIGILNSIIPETGLRASLINFSITDLRVTLSGSMHVSVRY